MHRILTSIGFRLPNIFAVFITRQLRDFGTGFLKHLDLTSETLSAGDISTASTIQATQCTRMSNHFMSESSMIRPFIYN